MTEPATEEYTPEDLLRLHDAEGLSWGQVEKRTGIPRETARGRARRLPQYKAMRLPPQVEVIGITAAERPDTEKIYERAVERWEQESALEQRRREQLIRFDYGPVALTAVGDLHFGADGTDYPRAFREAEIIRDTPGMYAAFVGDAVNNFIAGRLVQKSLVGEMLIDEGWILFRKWLRIIGPKMRLVVSGNHENWTRMLAGIDYMRECTASVAPGVIYDRDDCRIKLQVGEREWDGRIRHKWQGKSIYNPTHGIERAAKFDSPFDFGVGAHNHSSGVSRGFNVGGRSGMAVMCGTYKRIDDFAARLGFPKPNDSVAVALVFDEDTNSITGFESLEFAAKFMQEMYGSTS